MDRFINTPRQGRRTCFNHYARSFCESNRTAPRPSLVLTKMASPLKCPIDPCNAFPQPPGRKTPDHPLCPRLSIGRFQSGDLQTIREVSGNATASGGSTASDWQGDSATMVNMKVRGLGQYWWSVLESYTWSPSHDQCGMLRPFGTSSADRWYLDIVVVVAQAK